MKVINIPVHFLKEVKDDRRLFELFAVAVLLKINHPHSVAGRISYKTLMKEIRCKHSVAKRIIEGMNNSPFFIVNARNGKVFIPSFKSRVEKTFGKGKRKYQGTSDYCKKLEAKKYTLREIKRALRELLLENAVHVRQAKQIQRLGKAQKAFDDLCVTDAKECAMTLERLSGKFGLGRSSAWKYISRMVDDGRVGKTPIVAECVIPELNDVTAREWLQRNPRKRFHAWHNLRSGGWSGWANHGCIYTIEDCNVSESFKHVIWNHKRRIRPAVCQSGEHPDGEGYWAKHS